MTAVEEILTHLIALGRHGHRAKHVVLTKRFARRLASEGWDAGKPEAGDQGTVAGVPCEVIEDQPEFVIVTEP